MASLASVLWLGTWAPRPAADHCCWGVGVIQPGRHGCGSHLTHTLLSSVQFIQGIFNPINFCQFNYFSGLPSLLHFCLKKRHQLYGYIHIQTDVKRVTKTVWNTLSEHLTEEELTSSSRWVAAKQCSSHPITCFHSSTTMSWAVLVNHQCGPYAPAT